MNLDALVIIPCAALLLFIGFYLGVAAAGVMGMYRDAEPRRK